jgi:lipoyl(octanoyl) transferase
MLKNMSAKQKPSVIFQNLGLMQYQECWDYQEKLFQALIAEKTGESAGAARAGNHLLFVEHPHVYTLGKSGSEENLLVGTLALRSKQAEFIRTNRGGDITYHGPGQWVVYPIFDLEQFNIGIKDYVFRLEECIIGTLAELGITAGRLAGATGVWIDPETPGRQRKICAIGVRSSRYVTMHGLALNVNTDLDYFTMINPCGFTDKQVTSIQKELDKQQDMNLIMEIVKKHFSMVFGFNFVS